MKKFMLVSLIAGAVLAACEYATTDSQGNPLPNRTEVIVVDSCEYIRTYSNNINNGVAIVHKANCPNHGGKP